MANLVFAWSGLPDYAARCIRAVIKRQLHDVSVVATRPDVPIRGMEQSIGRQVNWLNGAHSRTSFCSLGIARPDVFFCGGHAIPAFRSLTAECNREGIPVVLLSDNYLEGSVAWRIASKLRHQVVLHRRFVGVLVPGLAGQQYAEAMGYHPTRIRMGLYSADPVLFHDGASLDQRAKRFLFVGRFNERKNVLRLAEAFASFAQRHDDWELHLCGSGPQGQTIRAHPRLVVHDFMQPPQLSQMMREARCLFLPSLTEHFGLVVHEAALSGCALALSDRIGAASDFAGPANAVMFAPRDTHAIIQAMEVLAGWDAAKWKAAGVESIARAARLSPATFADSVEAFVAMAKVN
jgi:glycosyltransferase involved in cell wall biosynthesis